MVPHLLMIAGGTGITPMYQIIKSSLKDPKDRTQLRLIYANVNEDDICMFCYYSSIKTIFTSAWASVGGRAWGGQGGNAQDGGRRDWLRDRRAMLQNRTVSMRLLWRVMKNK